MDIKTGQRKVTAKKKVTEKREVTAEQVVTENEEEIVENARKVLAETKLHEDKFYEKLGFGFGKKRRRSYVKAKKNSRKQQINGFNNGFKVFNVKNRSRKKRRSIIIRNELT